jgi:hypothetical protein
MRDVIVLSPLSTLELDRDSTPLQSAVGASAANPGEGYGVPGACRLLPAHQIEVFDILPV